MAFWTDDPAFRSVRRSQISNKEQFMDLKKFSMTIAAAAIWIVAVAANASPILLVAA